MRRTQITTTEDEPTMAPLMQAHSLVKTDSGGNGHEGLQRGPVLLGPVLLNRRQRLFLASFVIICLVIVFSRLSRLPTLEMDNDEVWSVWQTSGTPLEIIAWTPFDW